MKDFEELYDKYNRDVYHFLLKLTCFQPELAEELLQETFYQAFISFYQFRGECSMKTWLCQIARNTFCRYLRQEYQQRRIVQNFVSPPENKSVEQAYEKKEQMQYLYKAMETLNNRERTIIEYRLFAGLPYKEIAALLNMKETTVKVSCFRAKVKLQNILSEVYGYEI